MKCDACGKPCIGVWLLKQPGANFMEEVCTYCYNSIRDVYASKKPVFQIDLNPSPPKQWDTWTNVIET